MDSFKAMFWGTKVYINEKHQYLNNEILVQYLNLEARKLLELRNNIFDAKGKLLLHVSITPQAIRAYDERVWKTQQLMNKADKKLLALPPFDVCLDERKSYTERLYQCINRHSYIFEDGLEVGSYSTEIEYVERNEYGYLTCDENGEDLFWLTRFEPGGFITAGEAYRDDAEEEVTLFNADMSALIDMYVRWIEDVLRVQLVYAKLLDEYLHIRHAFLNPHEVAEQLEKYLKTERDGYPPQYRLGTAQPKAVGHKVIRNAEGQRILCDSYEFDSIGALLYTDFFKGLQNNHLPKKCGNCGRWFLLPFGKYSDYCENPLAEQPGKTCRDIGSHKKYIDKCKTDPVWLAYNRAYKAHYARYMKKKMTNAEFEKWSRYAVELRTKALDGGLDLEEYQRLIRL